MDANGKPQISRELLQRMTQSRPAPGSGQQTRAYGCTRAQQPNSRFNTDRNHIRTYTSSNVANSALNPYNRTRRTDLTDTSEDAETAEMYGQNRQLSKPRLVPPGGNRNAADTSHQDLKSGPKTTFKEPPTRNYDPFS